MLTDEEDFQQALYNTSNTKLLADQYHSISIQFTLDGTYFQLTVLSLQWKQILLKDIQLIKGILCRLVLYVNRYKRMFFFHWTQFSRFLSANNSST